MIIQNEGMWKLGGGSRWPHAPVFPTKNTIFLKQMLIFFINAPLYLIIWSQSNTSYRYIKFYYAKFAISIPCCSGGIKIMLMLVVLGEVSPRVVCLHGEDGRRLPLSIFSSNCHTRKQKPLIYRYEELITPFLNQEWL